MNNKNGKLSEVVDKITRGYLYPKAKKVSVGAVYNNKQYILVLVHTEKQFEWAFKPIEDLCYYNYGLGLDVDLARYLKKIMALPHCRISYAESLSDLLTFQCTYDIFDDEKPVNVCVNEKTYTITLHDFEKIEAILNNNE